MTPRVASVATISRRAATLTVLAVAVLGIAADVLTKIAAVRTLTPGGPPVPLVGSLLQLYLIRNPGAAFSIGEQFTPVFTVLAVLVLIGVLRFVLPALRHRGWAVGLGLVIAGITGNLIDRLVRPPGFGRGHVVDFLMLPHWPIFNVADICVVSGALLVMLIWVVRGVGYDGLPSTRQDPQAPDPQAPDPQATDSPDETDSDRPVPEAGP